MVLPVIRYISDLHFFHENIIRFDKRPFSSVEEMNLTMIERWNDAVSKDDITYVLGDFVWGTEKQWLQVVPKLNGSKVLILGNHDLKRISSKVRRLFQDVKDYKEIKDGDRNVILSHYPMCCFKHDGNSNVWHLHGHTHNTQEQRLVEAYTDMIIRAGTIHLGHIINVGCMLNHMQYTPRALDELIEYWSDRWKV